MNHWLVVILLSLLTVASAAMSVMLLLGPTSTARSILRNHRTAALLLLLGGLLVTDLAAFWLGDHGWQPLTSHLDGLLLICTVLIAMLAFLDRPAHLPGMTAFILPIVTLLLAWAICAAQWTWYVFEIETVWLIIHRIAVYVGGLGAVVVCGLGAMFLGAEYRLRRRQHLTDDMKLASLERIERLLVRLAAVTAALLTIVILFGFIEMFTDPRADTNWLDLKIWLGTLAWLIYLAIPIMSADGRYRGKPVAWLGIVAFLLVLGAMSSAIADGQNREQSNNATETPREPRQIESSLSRDTFHDVPLGHCREVLA